MNTRPLVVPRQASDANRSRIVLTLSQRGPLSRAELARLSGVTRTTIGSYVDRLIEEGVLEEVDGTTAPVGRGRPSRPVWFSEGAARCVAVLFDEDRVEVAVTDARGSLLDRDSRNVPAGADTGSIADLVLDLVAGVEGDGPDVLGLGLAVTGMVDKDGRFLSRLARFPGLDGRELVERLRGATGRSVTVDNDSRAAALAELWWGQGRAHRNFWTVQIDEGIGGGELIDGELARGAVGAAGEVGHVVVDRHGQRCACGLLGCWETIASTQWLAAQARQRGLTQLLDDPRRDGHMDVASLLALASTEPAAADLLSEFVENIALGLSNIVRLGDPSLIVLHGAVTAGGAELEGMINNALRERSLLYDQYSVRISFTRLGEHARLLGAGALVLASTWALER